MESQNKFKPMFWRRVFSALIDLVFIYCIAYLAQLIIMRWIFFDPFIVFTISWVFYYTACSLLFKGRTLAKAVTGLQVLSRDNEGSSRRQVVIREVVGKFLIMLVIPSYVIHRLHFYTKSQMEITGIVVLILMLIILVLFLIFNRQWWEQISSTKTIRNRIDNRLLRFVSFIIIAGIFVFTIYIKFTFLHNNGKHFHTRYCPEYPINSETKKYAEFIRSHSRNPVDYVFDLFEKYDLVVLDERLHPESTQYELISKIVADPRFASKIGNIYTELISQTYQDSLTGYLNTLFPNEDSLNMATAWLEDNSNGLWPIWGNTNLFDFLKFVNKINTHSPDSLKINWYGTDIPVNWAKMTPLTFQKLPRFEKRDKIMADRITTIYKDKIAKKEKKKKGLVIMNWWHGYGLIHNSDGEKTKHFFNTFCTTAILMDSLPGKVCNVIINRVPFGLFSTCFGPVQHGKWDKAFDIAGNPDVGFDFENSPFGNDNFDDFLWNSSSELQYRDVFTGFIYYKPLEQHIQKYGFPYILHNFQDTLIRRSSCLGETYRENIKNSIRNDGFKLQSLSLNYAVDYNIVVNIAYSLIILFTLIICLVYYLISLKR